MFKQIIPKIRKGNPRRIRGASFLRRVRFLRRSLPLTLIILSIEFFDELNYGVESAVLPALRDDLGLSYAQVGLLLGLPLVTSTLVEPALLLLGDTALRKRLVVGGGLAVSLSLLLVGVSSSFPAVLLAFILGYPASGAFVTLSLATLMDANPGREPHWMARWTAAGSLGNVAGPLIVAGGFALALGWRWIFFVLAALVLALTLLIWLRPFPSGTAHAKPEGTSSGERPAGAGSLRSLWNMLRNRRLLRWIILLELSDLLLDIFAGYMPLYFTDVVGASPAQAGLLLTLLMLTGLASDLALIPLLERVPGRTLVRASAALSIFIYAAWLAVPWPAAKIALLVLVSLSTLGWYPVLQGEAYASAPGQSGAVSAVSSMAGILKGGLVWLIGFAASQVGLPAAMWLLLLGPVSLALFMPRSDK